MTFGEFLIVWFIFNMAVIGAVATVKFVIGKIKAKHEERCERFMPYVPAYETTEG